MIAYVPFIAISSPVDFVLSYQTRSAYQEVIYTNSALTKLSVTYWNNEKKLVEHSLYIRTRRSAETTVCTIYILCTRAYTVRLCVSYGSHSKQGLYPLTSTGLSFEWSRTVLNVMKEFECVQSTFV
jgi:hypothetical protein